MFRSHRPTFENLERREVFSAGPIVGPSLGAALPEIRAQDMYGDTMSIEEWMDWTAREHDYESGDNIFDFPGGRDR